MMTLRPQVIWPIFRRNFASYFSGVLGYLFILVFVVAAGAMAFNAQFFTANEPSFDQLTKYYPYLLLFFVPAITMSVWAEEKKTGTDELLFTMPATDLEILLGKYFSVLAVYTVSLLFSTTLVVVQSYLGNPDWGLILTTYFGYWIAGAALLSAGMVASSLTSSMTVAFVIGIVICSVPVFLGQLGRLIGFRDFFEGLSLQEQFQDFGIGVVPLSGLLYFVALTLFMLYLNLVLMTRRHWKSGRRADMGAHYSVRTVSLALILICATAWAAMAAVRVDATSERLYSLSPVTRKIIRELDAERPIEIQAFISPEVPREYVETRKRLLGLLRQFDEMGGRNLEVRLVEVAPFSEEADEAEHFGIRAQRLITEVDGRQQDADVYLGAVVISSYDKVVVPFFGKGLPIEYELTRCVQTVSDEERHTVGILTTDAQLIGGGREWEIVDELKKQYNVVEVSPASEIDADQFDVLLAVLPSSLTAPEMDNLVAYVRSGRPVLIFDDPFPLTFSSAMSGVTNAPRQAKPRPGGHMGMFGGGGPPPEQKADGGRASRLLDALDIRWKYDRVVFDINNPHPKYRRLLPSEYVFITREGDNEKAFNNDSEITSGLEQVIALYSGTIEPRNSGDTEFTPLLATGDESSGLLDWEEFVEESGFSMMSMSPMVGPRRNPLRRIDSGAHVMAARITSDDRNAKRNAIFVADLDMISDFFFRQRNLGELDLVFDNVTFVLNAVDVLAGDKAFIELRSRRPRQRTLTRLEDDKRKFAEEASEAEAKADEDADQELEQRQEQLSARVKEIEENENLDPIAKQQMLRQAQIAEQQRLDLAKAQIEERKQRAIQKIDAKKERQERELEWKTQLGAVLLPPLPALLVGALVLAGRIRTERRGVVASRRRDA